MPPRHALPPPPFPSTRPRLRRSGPGSPVTPIDHHRAALPRKLVGWLALTALVLSGCGAVPTPPPGATLGPAAKPPAGSAVGAVVAQAVPQAVPPPAAPLAQSLATNPDPGGYAHREDAWQLAQALAERWQLPPDWVWGALSQARLKEAVTRLVMPPPAGTPKNWAAYKSRFIEPVRIRAGVAFWRAHEAALQRAQAEYGVPQAVIAGVLGVETIYGRNTGNFRVLDVLTTLSLDFPKGRSDRSAFFKTELGQYLLLCHEQDLAPTAMLGSYAGAIGLPQFMPSSIRRWAVDFDGDGRIDLANSPADAIGSVAHYLAAHGWQRNWPAYFNASAPTDTQALSKLLAPDIVPSFTAQEMQALGVHMPTHANEHPGKLALVELQNGRNMPSHVAGTDNFYAVTRYNQSSYYALAVLQLGEAIAREVSRQTARP